MKIVTLILVLVLSLATYAYFKYRMSYFSCRGILHLPPLPILGNQDRIILGKEYFNDSVNRACNCNLNEKYLGFYNFMSPVNLVTNSHLIIAITVKDFDHFTNRQGIITLDLDPTLEKSIFSLKNEDWFIHRNTFTPAFTTNNLKANFAVITSIVNNLIKYIDQLSDLENAN